MEPVTNVGVAVATEATTWSLAKIIKHIGYIFQYKENLKNLEEAANKLDDKRNDATRSVQDANRKLKVVGNTVAHWQLEADELCQNAQENISRNTISCLNLWSRYSMSKNAWKMAQQINEKVQTGPDFGTTFDGPTPKSGAKYDVTGFMKFESRESVLNEVWEALKDEKVRICSICGMGGTGKTTLAKKLVQRVEGDHLFDKVAMVTVSEQPNFEKIQNEIIELLGLKMDESSMPARANKLHAWLTTNRMTLLVLDDVWWQLKNEDFENIGIPVVSHEGCKLVVTSRNEDECNKMGSQRNFPINVLQDGEGWDLFRHIAGNCVDDLNILETARKIADECDGLPLVIETLAIALKDKPKGVWKDSLLKLQKSNGVGISELEKVYTRINLSYGLLNDPEAKSCFRLFSLFPEDHNVLVEHLVWLGKGLELFKNVKSMSETRDRVESIIDKLKKSFLLLDGEEDGSVKMHDILRGFAISISEKDKHPYIVACENVMEKWPESSQYENCSAISFVCDKIKEHLIDVSCLKLELLQLVLHIDRVGLPIGIFEGMKELKVLVLKVPSFKQSLTTLRKLRTLVIYETSNWLKWINSLNMEEAPKIGDILGHGDLENLEILVFDSRRPCNDFPKEIGLVCNLRVLQFDKVQFEYMPPGVLSKLVKLEELKLHPDFFSWGCIEEGGERVNASLDELESLPLTTLKISVPKGSILAAKLVKNLTTFSVCMGSYYNPHNNSSAVLEVSGGDACDFAVSWISGLMRKCESLNLSSVTNLKHIMCLQSDDDEFPQLKDIYVYQCNEMEYLVDTIAERIPSTFFSQLKILELRVLESLKEIWHDASFSKIETPYFSNLAEIKLYSCQKLKHLFPLSVARELRQLELIYIACCDEMEEIFYKDQVDDGNQVVSIVETASTPTILNPNTDIDHNKPQVICPTPSSFIRCLRGREKQLIEMVPGRQIIEENIAKDDEKEVDSAIMNTIILFPRLKTLELNFLPKFRILYDGNHAIEMPSLEEFTIDSSYNMEALSCGSFIAQSLKEIEINGNTYPAAGEDLNNAIMKKSK